MKYKRVCLLSILLMVLGTVTTDAGYYKNRPHHHKGVYSIKPTVHFRPTQKPHGFHSHYRRPIHIHGSRPSARPQLPPRPHPPPRPYIVKPTPPPFPPASWKTRFNPPVVKEPFHSPQVEYTPQSYVKDDDKGPIHTIPAPNLSPSDRPAHNNHANDLQAVLKHGQNVQANKPIPNYQVTEDPSVYKPYSGSPSYFAPDPDPSLPTLEVPQTLDPHSQPSNGQIPLDLYQQQQVVHQQVIPQVLPQQVDPHQTYANGNSLSSQDLYNLLHGAGDPQQMTPELYQQYLQAASLQQPSAYHQVYTAGLLYPQQYQQQLTTQFSQQNFHPQYETFNYNEQTQESAHGSDSFPAASSLNVGVKRAVSQDTGNSGESSNRVPDDQQGFYEERQRVGVINNQVDYEDERSTEENEKETSDLLNSGYFSTLPNKQAADTLATLAAAGNINNQIVKSPNQEKQESNQQSTYSDNNIKRQNPTRYESNSPRNNEIRGQEKINKNEQNQHPLNTNENEHRQQSFSHEVDIQFEEEKKREPYRNHNMGGQLNNHDNNGQQSYNNQNEREQQSSEQSQNENSGQSFSESDYSEEEILEPSDKDQMKNVNIHNGMRGYEAAYYKNSNGKEEDQSYEDSENDYTQEEESEINKAVAKSSTTVEKTVNYNAHQNKLPFGTKLRPKRV